MHILLVKNSIIRTTTNLLHQVPKSPAFIFDYLTDMQKFVMVHPVVYRIDPLGADRYLVHERLKVGFIPYHFTYPVAIAYNVDQKTVLMKSTVMKMIDIEMRFTIVPDGSFSMVKEEVLFKTFLPVKSKMERIFKEQHQQLFINIGLATD